MRILSRTDEFRIHGFGRPQAMQRLKSSENPRRGQRRRSIDTMLLHCCCCCFYGAPSLLKQVDAPQSPGEAHDAAADVAATVAPSIDVKRLDAGS